MGLINQSAFQYYARKEQFLGDGAEVNFTLTLVDLPTSEDDFEVYIDGVIVDSGDYSYASPVLTFSVAPANNIEIVVELKVKTWGNYRYVPLSEIVNNFMFAYVGPGKILSAANRRDVLYHAKMGIRNFSFDMSRVEKIQEVEIGPSLSIPMPQDFIGLVAGGISFVDDAGVEHPIPEIRITSKPSESVLQDENYDYIYDENGDLVTGSPIVDENWKNNNATSLFGSYSSGDYFFTGDYIADKVLHFGERYGADPSLMNENGGYIIDEKNGTINFSSNLSGVIITLKYVSDGLGNDDEMKVHKYCEQAIYRWIAYEIMSTSSGYPAYAIRAAEKKKTAEMRNAKIRISRIKPADLMPALRGGSKHIKH